MNSPGANNAFTSQRKALEEIKTSILEKKRADAGDVAAMLDVSDSFAHLAKAALEDGQSLEIVRNLEESAKRYLSLAAKAGSAEGAYRLGVSYETGFGGKRDLNLAYKAYEIAAERGWNGHRKS